VYDAIVKADSRKDPEVICRNRSDLVGALYRTDDMENMARAVNLNIETTMLAETELGVDQEGTLRIRYDLGLELIR
jgi:hypothetical protein